MPTPSTRRTQTFSFISHPAALSVALVLVVAALYGPFLGNPPVFDDKPLFSDKSALAKALVPHLLDSRWVAYITLAWTRELFGSGIVPMRVGNLVLHAANAVLLFLFLRRLFQFTLSLGPAGARAIPAQHWLAFLAGALFALHPVAVYAAAYLVQRSILMASLFCLLMWFAYLEGLVRRNQSLLLLSALFYYLATSSKELSIMAPAVALCLTSLLREAPYRALLATIAPTFLLYAAIAVLTVLNALHIIGIAYEPYLKEALTETPERALLLSAINQSFLYFKYLLLWIAPYPGWMSVDMRVPFPASVFALPQALGPPALLLTIAAAIMLLLRGRRMETRLAGFALLAPVLMFLTEFSAVRIQEPFVLYRSYLWFGLLSAALPALAHWVNAKKLGIGLAAIVVAMAPASWNRLVTFSDPVLLWSDAVALVRSNPRVLGADRIYYNRGNALLREGRITEAGEDYDRAVQLNSTNQSALTNLGYTYYQQRRYKEAAEKYRQAVTINPLSRRPHYGLGMSYRALGEERSAREHFSRACEMRYQPACLALTP